jgi:excinuclease UvrABC nuclease subunit
MNTNWRHIDYHSASGSFLPKMPGVYAVMRVKRAFGIPIDLNVLYVGKSKNLFRRFTQHVDPYRQHNKSLNDVGGLQGLEFWYVQASAEELDQIERKLIRELSPSANVVRYANADAL